MNSHCWIYGVWCIFGANLLPDLESRLTAYLMHNEIQYWSAFGLSAGSIEKFMGFQIYCAFQTWNRRIRLHCAENSVSTRSIHSLNTWVRVFAVQTLQNVVFDATYASMISASFFHSNGWTLRKKPSTACFVCKLMRWMWWFITDQTPLVSRCFKRPSVQFFYCGKTNRRGTFRDLYEKHFLPLDIWIQCSNAAHT